jgi:CheY-like chemotaxis protein/anti-sigma regulatory factor (Ser/Thr protein kinase)
MTILVVDDSPIDRRLASRLLEQAGFETRSAENGHHALAALETKPAEVVVTDLVMPEMDGLTLVETIRARYPSIPVILMTAHGSDDIGVRALQRGAASFVPKRELARCLGETVRSVLSLLQVPKPAPSTPPGTSRSIQWELGNDVSEIPDVVARVERRLGRSAIIDGTARIQLAVALREAIVNAMLHGNLELPSALKESDPAAHDALALERRVTSPYSDRRVRVSMTESDDDVTCVVSDDGAGFDVKNVPDPTDPANLERTCGRGLFLIWAVMSEVTHSDNGRTITMIMRRRPNAV